MSITVSPRIERLAPDWTDAPVRTEWYSSADNPHEALALRHRGYVHAGLIEASPFGVFTDPYDELETTLIAAVYRRGVCVGTLRSSFYVPGASGPALPCEKVYPEVAGIMGRADGMVVELSRLSIDPSITNMRLRARLYAATIRAGITACVALGAKHLLAATQTKWQTFYQHVLGFKAMGAPQLYPPGNVPVVLLARDLDENLMGRIAQNPFFRIDAEELASLRELLPSLVALPAPSIARMSSAVTA